MGYALGLKAGVGNRAWLHCTQQTGCTAAAEYDRASVNLSMSFSLRTVICFAATSCTPPRSALYTCSYQNGTGFSGMLMRFACVLRLL